MRTPLASLPLILLRNSLLIGWLCLLLAPLAKAEPQTEPPVLMVLGDSISAAYGMSLQQGWVSLLGDELQQRDPPWQVVNASISGDTTAGGLRRLPALLEAHQPQLVIIELGGNDGLRGYPVGKLQSNLEQMARLAREAGARVLILPMEIPPNYGARYTQLFRESFAAAARESGSTLGPFLLDGVATDPALMQDDGIHPTIEAQPQLLDNLRDTILELL
ncbi:arylesterase [Parahaliea aestuarii]|uniref:Arylesterase n=1 Tax=Parahaliea aestuarii TaxID=1852021 RepID=A0A5C8ZQY5_9GAMM|nr:arylesterase [Parahaliea aestuarii]TXS90916.1 arylesterase [Parahaliea aestuarii]